MSVDLGKALALTAVTGLIVGIGACGGKKPADTADDATTTTEDATEDAVETTEDATTSDADCCKGKNECKGKGNCKTDANECKGNNECKSKGGCQAADCAGGE